MHKLGRRVRFSVNPFLSQSTGRLTVDSIGYNSYCSKPSGEGLSIFLELSVELAGPVEPSTGFIVNVSDIDRSVRQFVVPVFSERIKGDFKQAEHIGLFTIAGLLRSAWTQLADRFGDVKLSRLSLKLNPFREVAMDSYDAGLIYFSEKFEFAAMHKLWNDSFTEQRNFEIFGRCANPTGHGHNYIVEVTIKKPAADEDFSIADFEKVVDEELIKVVDHRNLNEDVPEFAKADPVRNPLKSDNTEQQDIFSNGVNPTVENIAVFAWNRLVGKFSPASLYCITVWETDRTYCAYYG